MHGLAERTDGGETIVGAKRKAMQLDTDTSDREFIPGALLTNTLWLLACRGRSLCKPSAIVHRETSRSEIHCFWLQSTATNS